MPVFRKKLGILGGGQLGRMSALAAARLGIETHIYTPYAHDPASFVAASTIVSDYDNKKTLKDFADRVDVITYEFENIPVETIRYLQKFKPVYPDDTLLEIAQNRISEKSFLNKIGIPTTKWAPVTAAVDIEKTLQEWDVSDCILKTTRFGYDGKGQIRHTRSENPAQSWTRLNTREAIAEEIVDFSAEISVIIARDKLGQTATYGAMLNTHRNHILARTIVPAPIPDQIAERAREMTLLLAEAVDLVGVLTLEMFLTHDGRILANEIAPRTHNSGHWTIDACACSQFENHVRAVCALNVGSPARHSDAVMLNLIGQDVLHAPKFLEIAGACVHLYGKEDIRDGRKMGHVTLLRNPGDSQDFPSPVRALLARHFE